MNSRVVYSLGFLSICLIAFQNCSPVHMQAIDPEALKKGELGLVDPSAPTYGDGYSNVAGSDNTGNTSGIYCENPEGCSNLNLERCSSYKASSDDDGKGEKEDGYNYDKNYGEQSEYGEKECKKKYVCIGNDIKVESKYLVKCEAGNDCVQICKDQQEFIMNQDNAATMLEAGAQLGACS